MRRVVVFQRTKCWAQRVTSRAINGVLVFNLQRRHLAYHAPGKFCTVAYVLVQVIQNHAVITWKKPILLHPFSLNSSFYFLQWKGKYQCLDIIGDTLEWSYNYFMIFSDSLLRRNNSWLHTTKFNPSRAHAHAIFIIIIIFLMTNCHNLTCTCNIHYYYYYYYYYYF